MTTQVDTIDVGFDDHVSDAARAAADALRRLGEESQSTETRVTRAAKSGQALANQYGAAERLAAKLADVTRRYARELADLERSELSLADKERLRASILAQQDAALQKASAAHQRWLAGMRASDAAVGAQNAGLALATASANGLSGALADLYAVAGSATGGLSGAARALQSMNADFQAGRASFAEYAAAARGLEASLRGISAAQRAIHDSVGLSGQTANTATIGPTRYAVTGRGSSGTGSITFGDDGSAQRLHNIEAAFAAADAEVDAYRVSLGLVDTAQRKYQAGLAELQSTLRRAGVEEAEATRLLAAYSQAHDPAALAARRDAEAAAKARLEYVEGAKALDTYKRKLEALTAARSHLTASEYQAARKDLEITANPARAGSTGGVAASDIEAVKAKYLDGYAAVKKLNDAVAELQSKRDVFKAAFGNLDEYSRAMKRLRDDLDPVAIAARKAAADNEKLAASYKAVMGSADPAVAAEQRYQKALADLRAGAVAAGKSAADLAADEAKLTAALSPAAIAVKKEEDALRSLIMATDKAWGADEKLVRQQAMLDKALRDGVGGIRLTVDQHAALSRAVREEHELATRSATSTKLAAHEMTNLTYQIQDAAVQLAGGQNPFLIIAQQGPQATGAVGGVSRAMALLVSPTTLVVLGITAVAGALALVGARAAQISAQTRGLTAAMRAYGTEAQTTAGHLRDTARALYEGGADRGESFATAKALAAFRGISASRGRELALLGSDMTAGMGGSVDDMTKQLAAMVTDGYPAIMKLHESIRLLTPAEAEAVRTMAEHGRQSEALGVALEALHRRFDGLRKDSMSPAATAMHELGVQVNRLVDAAATSPITIAVTVAISDAFKAMADFLANPSLEGIARVAGVSASMTSPGRVVGSYIGGAIGERLFGPEDEAVLQRRIADAKARLDGLIADTTVDHAAATIEIDRARTDIAALEKRLDEINGRTAGAKPPTATAAPHMPARRSANDIGVGDAAWIEQNKKATEYVNAQTHEVDRLSASLRGNAVDRALATAAMRAQDEIRDQHLEGIPAENLLLLRQREALLRLQVAVNDSSRAATAEVAGAELAARAYGQSTAAVREAEIQSKALAEAARGTIEPYDAIVTRLRSLDEAQRNVQAAQFGATLKQQTEDANRLATAWGQGANAAREAVLANEALAEARKRGLDPTRDAGQIRDIGAGILARDAAQRGQQFAQMAAEQRQAVSLANAEFGMLGQSNFERARSVAMLQAANDLRAKGADLTDAGTQAYIRQAGELARVNSQLQDAAQNAANVAQPITSAFEDVIVGAKKAGDAGKALAEDMKRVFARVLFTKPAETWLTGTLTKLMSGPVSPANDNTPTPANDPASLGRIVTSVSGGLGSSPSNAMWVQMAGSAAAVALDPQAMTGSAPLPVAIKDGGQVVDLIRSEARAQGVPEEVALAIGKIESGFRQYRDDGRVLTSSAGAMGVMQLMPGTAQWLGVDATDTRENVRGGIKYLAMLGRQFGGDWTKVVAAYNAGPTRMQQHLTQGRALPAETVTYVDRFGKSVQTANAAVATMGARVGGVTKAQESALQAQLDAATGSKVAAGSTQSLSASQSALVASVLGTVSAADAAASTIEAQSWAISHIGENAISAADHLDDAADGAKALAKASDSAGDTLLAGAQSVYSGFATAISGIWNWVTSLFSGGSSGGGVATAGAGAAGSASTGGLVNFGVSKGLGYLWDKAGGSSVVDTVGGWLGLGGSSAGLAAGTLPSASVQASQIAALQAVNPGFAASSYVPVAGGVDAAAGAGSAGGLSLGSLGSIASGALSLAGAGYSIGGYFGTMANSKAVGGLTGGAAAGALAGTMAMPGIGSVIGAIIGGIAGMIGTQKATVGPTASADITINAGGKSASAGNFLTDNDGSLQDAQNLGTAFSTIFTAAALGGGTLARNFGIGQTAAKGLYVAGSVPYKEFGAGVDALGNLLRYTLLDQGGLTDAGPNVTRAIRNTRATTYEDAARDIALGASLDAGTTALSELDETLAGITRSAKDATTESLKPMLEELDRAKKLDLGGEYSDRATKQLKAYLQQLQNPVEYTTAEQQMATITGQFQALREAAVQLDPALGATVDQIEAETRSRIKRDAQTEADQLLNAALDREYVNQINALSEARDKEARNLVAAGLTTDRATETFDASLRKLLDGLDVSDLDVVATLFGGAIGDLATSMRETSKEAVAAAAALKAYNADLSSRMYSAVGAERGSGLLALDQQQSVEMAQAKTNGYDTSLLALVQGAERANKAFTLAQADVLAWYDQEISARQSFISELQEGAYKVAQAAKQFAAARDALAISQDAPISPQERLTETKRQWDAALATVRSTTASDEDRDTARSTLISLGQTLTSIEKENSGGTARSLYDEVMKVLGDLGALAPDSAAAAADAQIKVAQDSLKELQKARTEAASMGQRQLGSLDGLKDTMGQSLAIWQAALTPLQKLTGTTSTTPRYGAPENVQTAWNTLSGAQQGGIAQAMGWGGAADDEAFNFWLGSSSARRSDFEARVLAAGGGGSAPHYGASPEVQSAWNGLSGAQQVGIVRALGWAGAIDQAFNVWLAADGNRASTFESYIKTIAGGAAYAAPADIMRAWGALSADQQAIAVQAAGYSGGVDSGLNAWAQLGHQADFESAVRLRAHAAGIPGFAVGTMSTPPGAVWVGEAGPELVWQGGGAAVASSVDSMRIAGMYQTAANDRYPVNVAPIRPPAGPVVSDNREILAVLRDIARRIERLEAAIHEAEGEAQTQRSRIARDELKLMRQQLDELQEQQAKRAA